MKPCLLLLACLILLCRPASGQYLSVEEKKGIVNCVLRTQHNKKLTVHKSTSQQQRLIAYSQTKPYDANLLWDTASIRYSGERISYFDNLLMFYDLSYPEYNSTFDFYFELPILLLDKGDVWADSTIRWRRSYTTQAMNLYDETIKQFDNNDNLLSVNMHQHFASDHWRYEHVYDTQGRIVRTYKLDLNNSDTARIYYFEYDTAGNMIRDSMARRYNNQWIAGRSTFFSYNLNNDIATIDILSSQLDSEYHSTIIYDNLDRIFHVQIDYNYGLYWEPQYQEFFNYPGNDPDFMSRQSMQWSGNWHFYDRYVKISNSNVTDTLQYFLYEDSYGWIKQYQTGFTYNTFGNVEQGFMTFYDLFGDEFPDLFTVFTYYYDQFFPAGVKQLTHLPIATSYPNPAENIFTIKLENISTAERVSIFNAQGQNVMSEQCRGKGAVHLDLKALCPGIYYFVLADKHGAQLSWGKVEKQ